MGPMYSSKQFCHCQIFNGKKLSVSYFHTWMNFLLYLGFSIIYLAKVLPIELAVLYTILYNSQSIILLILIQTIDKCKKCCCSQWCMINCLPITNRTILDTDQMDELIEIQENEFQEEWNMVEVVAIEGAQNICLISEIRTEV